MPRVFNTHGFHFNTHGFLLHFQRLQTSSDCISTRQINSLKFTCILPTALRYTIRYPRFSTLTVPPVFPTSSNTQTTPRLVRLHQHQTNHQICTPLPTAPSLHKSDIHGFSTCIPKYLQCFNHSTSKVFW